MRIRRARPEEYVEIGAITEAAYEPFLTGAEDDYRAKLRDAASRDLGAELWVAADGGTVLGSVTLCPEGSSWRELAVPGEGEFRMLAVSPAAQGRGVGRALAEHVLAHFRAAGSTSVVLSSLPMMASAHRVYTRLGFVRVPERDWSPMPGVDLIAFGMQL